MLMGKQTMVFIFVTMQEQSSEDEGDDYETDSVVSVYNITSYDLDHCVESAGKVQKRYLEQNGDVI